ETNLKKKFIEQINDRKS
ncbi:hypothetical protein SNEBB_008923, partial [Seison nebaliae]